MKNDLNNSAKRTASQVNAILKANNITEKCDNAGDGKTFILTNTLFNRVNLKKAGFIVIRTTEKDKAVYFKTN